MKKLIWILIIALLISVLSGCDTQQPQIAATTLPVYEFTSLLCQGTNLTVGRLVTENVSCLHDYTLQVSQMRQIESAELIVISGAGLEEFLDDALSSANRIIDASAKTCVHEGDHEDHGHGHAQDPHIWLSPANAKIMVSNICDGLTAAYPEHAQTFAANATSLYARLDALQAYGDQTLQKLDCRELITFHDGFSYFAESFNLTILRAIEEESGSEASAKELIELLELVEEHSIPAVFIESNGSVSAAQIISAEQGADVYMLDMGLSGESYFDAMYHNIDTVKEALG